MPVHAHDMGGCLDLVILERCASDGPVCGPLMRPDGREARALALGRSIDLAETQSLFLLAWGQPCGYHPSGTPTTTRGCYGGYEEKPATGRWLKADFAVHSGSSGGPVLNSNGEVVGWVVMSTKCNDASFFRAIEAMFPLLRRIFAASQDVRLAWHLRTGVAPHVQDEAIRCVLKAAPNQMPKLELGDAAASPCELRKVQAQLHHIELLVRLQAQEAAMRRVLHARIARIALLFELLVMAIFARMVLTETITLLS